MVGLEAKRQQAEIAGAHARVGGQRLVRDHPAAVHRAAQQFARFWGFAGYQHEFTGRICANIRRGLGVHLWRTDELAHRERILVPAGDLNLGFRF